MNVRGATVHTISTPTLEARGLSGVVSIVDIGLAMMRLIERLNATPLTTCVKCGIRDYVVLLCSFLRVAYGNPPFIPPFMGGGQGAFSPAQQSKPTGYNKPRPQGALS